MDHLFRREFGRMVAILTRRFGTAHLHLAEDVVQDALVKAMETWPFTGVPPNPTAWILTTARNRALDQARRVQVWHGRQEILAPLMEDCLESALRLSPPQFEDEIRDSQLRMMFVCGHPGLPPEARVALILKTLCGFSEREIATAFLASEEAINKRLVRARAYLREQRIDMELPPATELASRLETVLHALYLLFNEGYKASHGDRVLRADLCTEAIRLGELLSHHSVGHRPETHALLALMEFNFARLGTRVDAEGDILLLAEQDRTRWDHGRISRGMRHLAQSSQGENVTRYHLEAGIAASHCLAPSFKETRWSHILELYDQLQELDASPVVALNRAVALAQVKGSKAALDAVAKIPGCKRLINYHLLHAVIGHLQIEAGNFAAARESLQRAIELATLGPERELLEQRLEQIR